MIFYTSTLTEQHLKGLWFSCTGAELIQSVRLSHSTTVKIQLKMFTEALCKYPNYARVFFKKRCSEQLHFKAALSWGPHSNHNWVTHCELSEWMCPHVCNCGPVILSQSC